MNLREIYKLREPLTGRNLDYWTIAATSDNYVCPCSGLTKKEILEWFELRQMVSVIENEC